MKKSRVKVFFSPKIARRIERSVFQITNHSSIRDLGYRFFVTERQMIIVALVPILIACIIKLGFLMPKIAEAPSAHTVISTFK